MDPFLGQIVLFAGNFAPRGWAFCDGQLLAINSNQALFSILGTTYGGDGRTTFALPGLRGRVAIHPGTGPGLPTYRLGDNGGNPTTTLVVNDMPPHTHGLSGSSAAGTTQSPVGALPAVTAEDAYGTSSAVSMGNSGSTGSGLPFSNQPPYQALNYIIALQGVFPSRN